MTVGRTPVLVLVGALTVAAALGQGWQGERKVNEGEPFYSITPQLAVDSSGYPWLLWHGYQPGFSLMYAKWLGDRWDKVRTVTPDTQPGLRGGYAPSLCFDRQGRAWAAWSDVYEDNKGDVSTSRWADSCWSPPVRVNDDTSNNNEAGNIGSGGGETWCVWEAWRGYGINGWPFALNVSRWDSVSQRWMPVARLAPPDTSEYYWWNDMAVDARGRPHVVWCAVPLYCVLYSFYDGDSWSTPVPVNDTATVTASWMAAPRIVVDRTGAMHLCFTGAVAGAQHRDVFYCRNDGAGWSQPVRVTQDTVTNYDEWYSAVTADRPDNVWVTFDRQNEGPDQFRVYASHHDGHEWSPEVRLDGDSLYHDDGPAVCVGLDGLPWVAWDGKSDASGTWEVYYNRYVSVGVRDSSQLVAATPRLIERMTNHPSADLEIVLMLATAAHVRVQVLDLVGRQQAIVYDGLAAPGRRVVHWRCAVPSGVYFCRATADGRTEIRKLVVTGH